MKKCIYFLAAMAMFVGVASCGTQKQVATAPANVAAQPGDDVIAYALSDPHRRASGTATEFEQQAAITMAGTNARAELAKSIQQKITQGVGSHYNRQTAGTADPNSTEMVQMASDFASKANIDILAISKESVVNTSVVKIERHRLPNGMWECYACVEFNASVSDMAKSVSEKIIQSIPQEVKDQMGFQQHLFQQDMQTAFEDYSSVSK